MSLPDCVLAVDHRIQLVREAEQRGQGVDRLKVFKRLVAEAFLDARSKSETVQLHGGLILDQELGADGIALAKKSGVPIGHPAELSGVLPLELVPNFESEVLPSKPDFIKCLVSGRPDDLPSKFRAQNDTVAHLTELCERAGVPLVLELIVPRKAEETEEFFERSGRATLTRAWIHALTELGVKPAHWKLEGEEREESFTRIAEVCQEGQRIAILGKSAPLERLAHWFKVGRAHSIVSGFAIGRTIFWQPLLDFLDGATEAATVAAMSGKYLQVVKLWEDAAPSRS